MNFVFHTFKLDAEIAEFIYFNANNILMLLIVSMYYSVRPCIISLTVRNYSFVKVIIELLLLAGIGTIGSWYYTVSDIAVIVVTLGHGFYIQKLPQYLKLYNTMIR